MKLWVVHKSLKLVGGELEGEAVGRYDPGCVRTTCFLEDDLLLSKVVDRRDCTDIDTRIRELLSKTKLEVDVSFNDEKDRLGLVALFVDDVFEVKVSYFEIVD